MKHQTIQPIALLIHVVMCSMTGAVAKGVRVGCASLRAATFYCGRNIAHNVPALGDSGGLSAPKLI